MTLRRPVLFATLAFAVSRLALVLLAPEGTRFISEEMYVGASAVMIREAPLAWPYWAWMYTPYEGGSLWTMVLTAMAQLLVGENSLALKLPPIALGCFTIATVTTLLGKLGGARAAWVGAVLMLVSPLNIQVQELYNEGNHVDALGWAFLCVLVFWWLADRVPKIGTLLAVGLLMGTSLGFSYQVLPWVLSALMAWLLSRPRTSIPGLIKEGAILGVGLLLAVSPHLIARWAVHEGLWGIYGTGTADAIRARFWEVPLLSLDAIWTIPFRAENQEAALPLSHGWMWPVRLIVGGTMVSLAALRRHEFLECLRGLVPTEPMRASRKAAFGAPLLLLFWLTYSTAVQGNLEIFAWYHYPLYPMFVIAAALLAAELSPKKAAILGLLWLPLLIGHVRGTAFILQIDGPQLAHFSRGYSENHFGRFFLYNMRPWVGGPDVALGRISHHPPPRRHLLVEMLGRSLGGTEVAGVADTIQHWERLSFFSGLVEGDGTVLLEKPGASHLWPGVALPRAQPPAGDRCALLGRARGQGARGEPLSGRAEILPESTAWHAFGDGSFRGYRADKDVVAWRWKHEESPYPKLASAAPKDPELRRPWFRGFGYSLGLGGAIVQHRDIAALVGPDERAWLAEGIGLARGPRGPGQLERVIEGVFGAEALPALQRGRDAFQRGQQTCDVFGAQP